jgi:hypothetical protein
MIKIQGSCYGLFLTHRAKEHANSPKNRMGHACVATRDEQDLQAPKVEAMINGNRVLGCLLDVGSSVNVLASWLLEKIDLTINQKSSMRLRGVDQRSVKPLEQLDGIAVSVKGLIVPIDFQVLDIASSGRGYPIILGHLWLKQVRTINYWDKGKMTIGPHSHRIELNVNLDGVYESSEDSEQSNKSMWSGDSDLISRDESEYEGEIFTIESLPQALKL